MSIPKARIPEARTEIELVRVQRSGLRLGEEGVVLRCIEHPRGGPVGAHRKVRGVFDSDVWRLQGVVRSGRPRGGKERTQARRIGGTSR